MTDLRIYVEGGGDTAEQKAQLRQGMDALLKTWKKLAQEKRWKWNLVPCGGRRQAFDAFINARARSAPDDIVLLLVDSEAPVTASSRRDHLRQRHGDGWDLSGVEEKDVHLMAQTMEAWIVADPQALASFYGQDFRLNALPQRQNLEEEAKADCAFKLLEATRRCRKGEYHKIRHASEILKRIDPNKIRNRCRPHAEDFFDRLEGLTS